MIACISLSNQASINTADEAQPSASRPSTEAKCFVWPHAAIKLLINLRMERDEAFRGPVQKNKNLWEEITAALLAEGYHVSRNQVENKWKNLNKR